MKSFTNTLIAKLSFFILFYLPITLNAQENVALNKNIIGSGQSTFLTRIVDGNRIETNPGSTGSSLTPPAAEYIEIDLGTDYFIDSIVIIPSSVNENLSRRFMIKTWPSNVPYPTSITPYIYLNQSLFNRLIYTTPPSQGNQAFNVTNPATVPQTQGVNLGPEYPTVNGQKMLNLNIGVHKARYLIIFNLQDGPLSFNEIEVYTTTKQPVRSFVNGDFEEGNFNEDEAIQYIAEADMPGWSTTEAVGMWNSEGFNGIPHKGTVLEIWKGGQSFQGYLEAFSGNYFTELNAHTNGMIVQEPICLLPNEVFDWSFAHRGRLGTDEMALVINYEQVARFRNANTMSGTHEVVANSVTAGTTATKGTTRSDGWTTYSGSWTNSSPNSNVVTFGFAAVSTSSGDLSTGNYIDDVKIVTRNSVASFDQPSTIGSENLSVANLPKIRLSGNVQSGSSIQLQITGGTAVLGTHFNTTTGTNTIQIPIPEGEYDESDLTAIDITPYILVIPQSIPDDQSDKTIVFNISPSGGNILIPSVGSNFCQIIHNQATYTILEASLLPVSFGKVTAMSSGKDQVKIFWDTQSEQNNQGFIIEHSLDGISWNAIGNIPSLSQNGQSQHMLNYEFKHTSAGYGVHYYRVKQVDLDGQITYSNIARMDWKKSSPQASIYPNPFDRVLNFKINSPQEVSEMIIFDISGRILWKNAGFASYLDTQSFPIGMYILKITYRNELSETFKLIKKQ